MIISSFLCLGANPHTLIRTERAKTVHVKMLLTRKNKSVRKHKRTKSMADAEYSSDNTNDENTMDKSLPLPYKKKGLSESEKLIRDTLLHESKTMKPEKTCLNKINGIFECYENSLKNKPVNNVNKRVYGRKNMVENGNANSSEFILCSINKGYMTIKLNNTRRHNVLTLDVSYVPLFYMIREGFQ